MIGVLGINHNTAPLAIREQFAVSKEKISELGEVILQNSEATETVVLSTCNRTEIYYYHTKSCINKTSKQLKSILHDFCKVNGDFSSNFYVHSNMDAVSHLFKVTSGLDSMVYGEEQIVSQVKEAYLYCTNQAFTNAILMRLFQKSFETAKKVRTETGIKKGATSISYVAVDKCASITGSLENKKVLLIGTGETGRLVIQKMRKYGVSSFTFTNRTKESANELANENLGDVLEFSDFLNHLSEFDIIITATNAGKLLIKEKDVGVSIKKRNGKSQIYIDLSVPRNVDIKVSEINNITLLAIDELQEYINNTIEEKKDNKKDSEQIIDQMTEEYFQWIENRSLRPVIKSITKNMEKMHKAEIDNYKLCYSDETFKAVDEYAGRLTQKYIRTLIKKLKELNLNGNAAHALQTINELFEFDSTDDQLN